MSEPIRHHYIPVFYSKQWARPSDDKLCVYMKPYKKVVTYWKDPAATGYVDHLYTMPGVPPDQAQKIEKELMGTTDNFAAKALQVFLTHDPANHPLTVAEKKGWARFLYAMNYRTPEKIAQMKETLASMTPAHLEEYRALYPAMRGTADPISFDDFKAAYLANERNMSPLLLLPVLMRSKQALPMIERMNYRTIQLKQSGLQFLSSDRPLIMTNGLAKPEAHMVIPLSPTTLFVGDKVNAAFTYLSSLTENQLARIVNQKVTEQSHKYVYSNSSSHLSFVEKRLGLKVPAFPGDPADMS